MTNKSTFTKDEIESIYMAVFRKSTKQLGYYFKDFGNQIDSKSFRKQMIELKEGLSNLCKLQSNQQLNFQSIGRFNHQHSSKFHRDTAEDLSFLMLGYEPTKVDSKVYVADYTKYIEDQNISLEIYFEGNKDTNVVDDNKLLDSYITELTLFPKDTYRLLLLNNSKSFNEASYGVFHSAIIAQMIKGEDRVLNYIMMHLCDIKKEEEYTSKTIMEFINTDKVNR